MVAPPPLPPEPPPLIRLGMWGLTSRTMAQAFLWGCVGLGVVSILAGLVFPLALLGTFNFIGAWWYWEVIRWVDRHGGHWPDRG